MQLTTMIFFSAYCSSAEINCFLLLGNTWRNFGKLRSLNKLNFVYCLVCILAHVALGIHAGRIVSSCLPLILQDTPRRNNEVKGWPQDMKKRDEVWWWCGGGVWRKLVPQSWWSSMGPIVWWQTLHMTPPVFFIFAIPSICSKHIIMCRVTGIWNTQ